MRRTKILHFAKTSLIILLKLTILSALIFGAWQAYNYFFTINHISCSAEGSPCASPVLAELERLKGQKLTSINTTQLQQKILGSSPLYTEANFTSSLPGNLSLQLRRADLLAQLKQASYSSVLLVTDTLYIADQLDHPQDKLTQIQVPNLDNLVVGEAVPESEIRHTLQLTQQLKQRYASLMDINIATSGAYVYLTNGPEVLFDPQGNIPNQIRIMELILNQEHKQPIQTIDVRFSKPVITFSP